MGRPRAAGRKVSPSKWSWVGATSYEEVQQRARSCPSYFQQHFFQMSDRAISDSMRFLGDCYDRRLPNDPLSWPRTKALAEDHPSNSFRFGDLDSFKPSIMVRENDPVKVGAKSALARAVFQPILVVK